MKSDYGLINIEQGIFVRELKKRFLCQVKIDDKEHLCYIPSSCRLDNFFDLTGKNILLVPTKGSKATTKFALLAVEFKKNYIILNSNLANKVIEQNIYSRRFCYLGKRKLVKRELVVDNYKCDLFIEDSNTLIEIKSIITDNDTGVFPSVYSQRALRQLDQLYYCLKNGRKVVYIIVSLNPYLRSVYLDRKSDFYPKFKKCINCGMRIRAYTCKLNKEENIELLKSIDVN
jgi:DNA-binding protein, stimulates sugar fermentation